LSSIFANGGLLKFGSSLTISPNRRLGYKGKAEQSAFGGPVSTEVGPLETRSEAFSHNGIVLPL
jgi:hypothetical protein